MREAADVTRYDALVARLREAARPERPTPEPLRPYVEKVRRDATTVTDADVDALRRSGIGEDEIFEHTVSAAVAAGLERLEAGLRVLP